MWFPSYPIFNSHICPSVSQRELIFRKILCSSILGTFVGKIQVELKCDKNPGCYT